MSTSTQVMELFNIFAETYGKEKAQAIVKNIEEIINVKNKELATKGDLRETELKLTKEIREVELKLTKEIEQVRSNLIKWVVGLMIAQTSIIVTLVVTLIK